MKVRSLLPAVVLLLSLQFGCSDAQSSNATLAPLNRTDALRRAFTLQLDATGSALNEILCLTALTGLPSHCHDSTVPLWANATSANTSAAPAQLLQALVAAVTSDMKVAMQSLSTLADIAGSGGASVETVPPDAKPWSTGSASEPTFRGELVSLTPAVHVPAYQQSHHVAAAINADVSMLGALASKMLELYTVVPQPMMAAAMTGATLYMPAPSAAPDARAQPWFQGAVLHGRNIIIVVDMWTQDRASGVVRVLQVPQRARPPPSRLTPTQVARELVHALVSPLDRVCLVLSDDTNVPPPIELLPARADVKDIMLQLLAARAARSDRALYPRAKTDLQAAFHFLDSAQEATSTCEPQGHRCRHP